MPPLLTPDAMITGLWTTDRTSGLIELTFSRFFTALHNCTDFNIFTSSQSLTIHFKSAPEPECLLVSMARPGCRSRTRDRSRRIILEKVRVPPLAQVHRDPLKFRLFATFPVSTQLFKVELRNIVLRTCSSAVCIDIRGREVRGHWPQEGEGWTNQGRGWRPADK